MKHFKITLAAFVILTGLISIPACSILKPIGTMTLIEPPARPSEKEDTVSSVSVSAIVTGWVEAPAYILMDQKNERTPEDLRNPQWVPSVAYIVRHPNHGTVIFDFGLTDGDCAYGFKPIYWVPCRNEGYNTLASYLRANPDILEDITYLIPSHLHGDHVSGLSDVLALTSAPLLMTNATISEMKSRTRAFAGIPNHMLDKDMSVVSMNNRFKSDRLLNRVFDVYGDGSLRIFETPGHSNGHISAIARTGTRNIVLSFDASHIRENYELQIPSGAVSDEGEASDSLTLLRQIAVELVNVEIIFGHEPDQWKCSKSVARLGEHQKGKC